MDRFLKKCGSVLEVAVAELPELIDDGSVRTGKTSSDMADKRSREEGDGELDFATNSELAEFRSNTRRRVMNGAATESIFLPDGFASCCSEPASCCSSNASVQLVAQRSITDLTRQTESAQLATLTLSGGTYRSETTPSTEPCCEESGDMESTVAVRSLMEANSLHRSAVNKMPSEVEIEDFLSAAEKNLQKRFSDKYNFDVAKGVPLKGRYEWVPVKP